MEAVERSQELLIEILGQALSRPGEHRLFRSGKLEGLFPSRSGVNLESAELALREGYLQRVRLETKGKTEIEWVEITPKGVEYLHAHQSPVQALHDLRDTVRLNQQAIPVWLADMQQTLRNLESHLLNEAAHWQERLAAMERQLDDTLRRMEAATPLVPPEVLDIHPWSVDALNYLDRRRVSGGADFCPLPELFSAVASHHPQLSLTAFHDGLRKLHLRRAVELRPVDDPMQMTRPEYALLIGDAVYYLIAR